MTPSVSIGAAPVRPSPYADLLPTGLALDQATEPLDAARLRRSSLAIIVTNGFLKQVRDWQKDFGVSGDKPRTTISIIGAKHDILKAEAVALDPKRAFDATMTYLEARFSSVTPYDDIAAALAARADYILLLDFDRHYNYRISGRGDITSRLGAVLLTPGLKQQLETSFEERTPWPASSILSGTNSALIDVAIVGDNNFAALLPGFTRALDTAFASRGATMTARAPVPAAIAAPLSNVSGDDAAFGARLENAANAGELYVLGDEMAAGQDWQRAVLAFRRILTRFPADILSAKAADRLAAGK